MNERLSNQGIIIQLIEEMSELTQVLSKKLRAETTGTFPPRCTSSEIDEHLAEEIADVEMMIMAIKNRFGVDFQLDVEMEKERKLLTRPSLYEELT